MQYPNHEGKYRKESVFTPAEDAAHEKAEGTYSDTEPPESVVLIYQDEFFDHLVQSHDGQFVLGLEEHADHYLLEATDNEVGLVGNIGIGAPATAFVMERLIEYGVEQFVALEYAGCLQTDIDMSEILVCERAIRDEGTSYHYFEPSKYAHASESLVGDVTTQLTEEEIPYRVGTSWTTDAFFRETVPEVEQYADEGVITVDMEASATFAIAEYRDVDAVVVFVSMDYVGPEDWEPTTYPGNEPLERAFDATLSMLS
jgi:uridine phosphorylase